MSWLVKPARSLRGIISVPGDKSISHRAVMLGALAEGETRIENFLAGEDCLATVRCFRELGVEISGPGEQNTVVVYGRGPQGLKEPSNVLEAANSGTTLRLLTGILAGLPFFSVLTGDSSLRSRPMGRVVAPLREMGAQIWGRGGGEFAPLAVQGGDLHGISYRLPVPSAQVKSAVLLAGLFARGETAVTETVATRDHTERLLKHFGVRLHSDGRGTVSVKGGQRLAGRPLTVPGDISSAAFFLVAAACTPDSEITVTGVGINPTRTGILDVLKDMGADLAVLNVRESGGEPVADLRVRSSSLSGTVIAGDLIPRLVDEIPVLAVAAAAARGRPEIRDAAELRVKESDRLAVLAVELGKLGADIEELPDGLLIRGGRPLQGAVCQSHGDHRVAMALAVAGLLARGETVVLEEGCAAVSYPGFDDALNSLREK
ncbi:MAG: 3-phosphoshikimate 1-carboxyvinyltransferase [Desulfotomaculales bacterium]